MCCNLEAFGRWRGRCSSPASMWQGHSGVCASTRKPLIMIDTEVLSEPAGKEPWQLSRAESRPRRP